MTAAPSTTTLHKTLRVTTILTMLLGLFAPLAPTTMSTLAASVTGASFTEGVVVRDGVSYAKTGDLLTLTVTTDNTTQCVELTGAHTATQTGANGTTSWTFALTANGGNGVQTVTATAYASTNPHGKCVADRGETAGTQSASYTLDNDSTGPVVTSVLTPAPNAAGWNKTDVTITWSATDESGVKSIVPATDSVTANTPNAGVEKTTVATDNVGNTTTGRVTVKLDEDAPVVTGTRSPAVNAAGWNNTDVTVSFETTDALSGVDTQAAGKVLGEGANQSVTGTGTDVAGNSASVTVSGINVDKTAPTLSGTPTTQPTNGWYTADVVIAWTAGDALSGLAGEAPGNSTITGEGEGLTATQTVSDKAGNSTTTSSPAVNIDRTTPTTKASAPGGWNSTDQTITLVPSDAGSGVASTYYQIDTGAVQTGTSVAITSDGEHTLKFWSVDRAGNAETPKTLTVKVDKTAPSISSSQSPAAVDGWNNSNVTVSFKCEDVGSGIASCTPDQVVSTEGRDQKVTGTATDNAGNTASADHLVNLDKTAPTVDASVDRAPNGNGWYNGDVTVTFSASDALSGIGTTSAGTTLGEGIAQSYTGTATDAAGNNASDSVAGINIDKTAPSLTGTPSTTGWSRDDVMVTWSASDALSGLEGAAPAPSVVGGEGDDLFASTSVSDRAGNTTATTVRGIKIDRTAPNTLAEVSGASYNGWYDKSGVQVTLTSTDNLSGVAKTFYQVGTGPVQEYSGPFTHAVTGVSTITYWSVDVAGNTEGEKSLELKLDGGAPTTAISLPEAFATGWYADSVPVAFQATDTESGVAKTFYNVDGGETQEWDGTFDHTLDGTHTINFWSVDVAGNVEAAKSQEIKVDTSDPTITGSRTPAANDHGWNNTDVTVSFECTDSQSGVAIENCTPDTPVTNEGAGQSVPGTAQDNVGKTASTTVGDINIDKTAPTLRGAATTAPNAAGWYKGDVTVAWTGQDGLSGIDPATQPADSIITGEGNNLGVGPVTIQDKAGNSGNGSVSGIKIDRTAPSISGKTVNDDGSARSANPAGWFNSAVRVRFTATDGLSGIQDEPSDVVLNTDGANQSATGTATDMADNAASAMVSGINIDSQAPKTDADLQCTGKNGYCRGNKATLVLTAADQAGLSGVKEIRYSTNNGSSWTTVTGARATIELTLSGSGKSKVLFYAVDNAGNNETQSGVEVKYDTMAPTVTHSVASANAAGWSNADATVTFTAQDDSDGSGVATLEIDGTTAASGAQEPKTTSLTGSKRFSSETAGTMVAAAAEDFAGNVGTDSVTVKLDKTAPTIIGAIVAGNQGLNGWYIGPVTIRFTCSDALSGIATCPADIVVNTDGAAQKVEGTAVDNAGNVQTATVSGINIDSVKPVITASTVNASYTLGEAPTITCTAADATSGVDASGCQVTISGGTTNGVGGFTYTATATDNAGNVETKTGTYKMLYAWNGFPQPINDTAHQVGTSTSIFKAGSTVPVKFQLMDVNGKVIQASTAPLWVTPVKGSATSAQVDETAYTASSTTGGSYRWDSTSSQYIYNWGTAKGNAGYYWRIGVTLDDGQTYYVNIGLR